MVRVGVRVGAFKDVGHMETGLHMNLEAPPAGPARTKHAIGSGTRQGSVSRTRFPVTWFVLHNGLFSSGGDENSSDNETPRSSGEILPLMVITLF